MYKYFLPLILFYHISCSSGETNLPSVTTIQRNNSIAITLTDFDAQPGIILVNDKPLKDISGTDIVVSDDNYIQPGMNTIKVVVPGSTDTLVDSVYFSYELSYTLVKEYEHDIEKFTQGLFIEGSDLYESTGQEGHSGIWKSTIGANEIKAYQSVKNDDAIFGEGIAAIGNNLYQLSWENHLVFEYDKTTLKKKRTLNYPKEGWGLTTDGDTLIASDGSEWLYFINPADFSIYNQVAVSGASGKVTNLNELELTGRLVIANIWQSNTIVFIDKNNGNVLATADLTALSQSAHQQNPKADVLNGIAYDPSDNTLLVTGKLWPKYYRIKLNEKFDQLKQAP